MLSHNKYIIYSALSNINIGQLRYTVIADFIFKQILDRKYFLFEMEPTKNSIIYDVTPSFKKEYIYSKNCIYSVDTSITLEDLNTIVRDETFYLGYLIIVIGEPNKEIIELLSLLWSKELSMTSLEIFKLSSDGYSFQWYNPLAKDSDVEFEALTRLLL